MLCCCGAGVLSWALVPELFEFLVTAWRDRRKRWFFFVVVVFFSVFLFIYVLCFPCHACMFDVDSDLRGN